MSTHNDRILKKLWEVRGKNESVTYGTYLADAKKYVVAQSVGGTWRVLVYEWVVLHQVWHDSVVFDNGTPDQVIEVIFHLAGDESKLEHLE